jgi:hypothetical protein
MQWAFGVALAAGLLASACASRPTDTHAERLAYTDSLAWQWRCDRSQDQALQYWVSDEIRLVRSFSGNQQGVTGGRPVPRRPWRKS